MYFINILNSTTKDGYHNRLKSDIIIHKFEINLKSVMPDTWDSV
jgi:hypothetical protein